VTGKVTAGLASHVALVVRYRLHWSNYQRAQRRWSPPTLQCRIIDDPAF